MAAMMLHRQGYAELDDPEEASGGAAPAEEEAGAGSVRGHAPGGLLPTRLALPLHLPHLPAEPDLHVAAEAFAEDNRRGAPMLDSGDLPLRALAQGLSLLSIDELRRLRLPAMPWQATDGASVWDGLRKTPWKAHYTNALGFLISTGALIAHIWVIVVANMLIVFVSQSCPYPEKHDCKTNETMNNLSSLGQLVLALNWTALFACLIAEFVYFRREAWLISHLDDNDAAPYNQLPTFIEQHAKLAEGLRAHNKLARGTSMAVLLLCAFNLVFSCALLLTPPGRGGRFNGTRTLVGLVSNTMLLARRVIQNARISNLSSREDLGLSLYQMKFRSFNDLGSKRKAAADVAKGVHGARPITPPVGHDVMAAGGAGASGHGGGAGGVALAAAGVGKASGQGGGVEGARHTRSRSEGVPSTPPSWASPARERPPPTLGRVADLA